MTPPAQTLEALSAILLALAVAGCGAALRLGARARSDRLKLRLALEREAVFVEAARRLADAAGTSIDAVRQEIDRAVRAIAAGIESVLFFEEEDAVLECVAVSGPRTGHYLDMRIALDDEAALIVLALQRGHRLTATDVPHARLLHPGDRSAAAVPLVLEAGRRCVLYVGGRDAGIDGVIDRLVSLVDQATPAYRIALERAEDRARAEFDALTGLLGGRALRTRLAELIDTARYGAAGRVGLLFIDTDHFKAWNDTYGHASGDALLRELARVLRAAARHERDIVARNGGDEFCVVFADAQKSETIERAVHLCASIAGADFRGLRPAGAADAGDGIRISASIGAACLPADAQTASDLLERADAAMYHSKRTGRNGVSFFSAQGVLARAGDPAVPPGGQ